MDLRNRIAAHYEEADVLPEEKRHVRFLFEATKALSEQEPDRWDIPLMVHRFRLRLHRLRSIGMQQDMIRDLEEVENRLLVGLTGRCPDIILGVRVHLSTFFETHGKEGW